MGTSVSPCLAPEDPPVGGVSDNTVNPAAAAGSGAHSVAPGPAPGSARIPRLPAPPAAAATEHRACNISPPIRGLHLFTFQLNVSVFCGSGGEFRGDLGVI